MIESNDCDRAQVRWSTVTSGKDKAPYRLTLQVKVLFLYMFGASVQFDFAGVE